MKITFYTFKFLIWEEQYILKTTANMINSEMQQKKFHKMKQRKKNAKN